jgi:DNA-binding LytR/AlgR family response regulator
VKNSFKAEVKGDSKEADDFIFIKTDGKNNFEKCKLMNLLYRRAEKNYVAIHLKDRQVITNNTKSIEDFFTN